MTVLETYLEILTNFFEILYPPLNAILQMWKKFIKQTSENTSWRVVKDHHLLWGSKIIILENLSSK